MYNNNQFQKQKWNLNVLTVRLTYLHRIENVIATPQQLLQIIYAGSLIRGTLR